MDQMLGTFLPTVLLWALAWFTLFIDIGNFWDRFVGTVTTLLVLVALLSSLSDDMPKTSYFKFIDLWFFWYIANAFIIIWHHMVIENFDRIFNKKTQDVLPLHNTWASSIDHENSLTQEQVIKSQNHQRFSKESVSAVAIVVYPTLTAVFNIVYFYLCMTPNPETSHKIFWNVRRKWVRVYK